MDRSLGVWFWVPQNAIYHLLLKQIVISQAT